MERRTFPRRWAPHQQGVKFDIMATSFFLGRRSVARRRVGMPLWQDKVFIFLTRNAAPDRLLPHPAGPCG